MELVDHLRPVHQGLAVLGRLDAVPADLDQPVTVTLDLAAEVVAQHLRAETDAEEGRFSFSGTCVFRSPGLTEVVGVVGAHRATEHDGAGVAVQRVGQRVAERRTADVEIRIRSR